MTTVTDIWLPPQEFVAHLSNYLPLKKCPELQAVRRICRGGTDLLNLGYLTVSESTGSIDLHLDNPVGAVSRNNIY